VTTTNHLDVLLSKVDDPALRAQLEDEVKRLRDDRQFGLVFERHLPETVRLYTRPVRRGVPVQVRDEKDGPTWWVKSKSGDKATPERLEDGEILTEVRAVDELVVVAEFGQAVYPGFKSVGTVERGGDKPFHTVINGENYHAIEALAYAYEGQVDCIYIDPPYNTGARDWKYNNDYVESEDTYRHSKWLSFMEKRLKVAKRLLNPADSVLIVTIDEVELHRLGMARNSLSAGQRIH
jgi:adenine-specific DNA-methyltransferase